MFSNRCVLKQEDVDCKIGDTLLKRGTKVHTDGWDTHRKTWSHVELCMWFIRFNWEGIRKEKTTVKILPVEIVLGNLVIMRISVHSCQRKFLNKHLRFSIHVLHAWFIPTLVSKSYVSCIFYVRTFPVLLYTWSFKKAINQCFNSFQDICIFVKYFKV
jgi:hypothetical protein